MRFVIVFLALALSSLAFAAPTDMPARKPGL